MRDKSVTVHSCRDGGIIKFAINGGLHNMMGLGFYYIQRSKVRLEFLSRKMLVGEVATIRKPSPTQLY